MSEPLSFVVAGHLCADLAPVLSGGLPKPGGLAEAGPLQFSCGGAVANVGSALWRLGCPVRLVALVGNDRLREIAIQMLRPLGDQGGVRFAPGQATSYSIVIAPQGCDRAFLHCPGANSIFTSKDVRDEDLDGAGWLHFGYPPVMAAIAADDGRELADLLCRAQARGLRTSLDLCSISGAGLSTDWRVVLKNCADAVSVFTPSLPELRVALRQSARDEEEVGDVSWLAGSLLDMGFSVVVIKMGTAGLYLATTSRAEKLRDWGLGIEWGGRELMAPCFKVEVVNTTGAGDCAIAGFIASVASGSSPEQALTMAAACGACSAEGIDASSCVRPLAEVQARIESGWERMHGAPAGEDWSFDPRVGIWDRPRAEELK